MNSTTASTEKSTNKLVSFEICGQAYRLSDYYLGIERNQEALSEHLPTLEEFPYSVRQLKGDLLTHTMDIPVKIVYNGEKSSLGAFLSECREFESQLPLVEEINGLERKFEFIVIFDGVQNKDSHAEIIETFRVFQDLYFTLASARWALIQAHRILHLKSEVDWKDGWEQLWIRASWLNNAIVMYNSCFDKLLQTIWIGTKKYIGYQYESKKKTVTLQRNNLFTTKGLEQVYMACDYDIIQKKLPKVLRKKITGHSNDLKKVRKHANRIKHRGGMRYKGLFPYGNISNLTSRNSYSAAWTKKDDDIDIVIEEVKKYHIAFCELVREVFEFIMDEFKKQGHLTDSPNKVVFSVQKKKTKIGVYKLGKYGAKIEI